VLRDASKFEDRTFTIKKGQKRWKEIGLTN